MRQSQRTLLTALGVVIVIMAATVIWVRFHLSPAVELSGQRVTLTPALTDFEELSVRGTWQLDVQQGESWRVELDIPLELQDRIEARVEGGRLSFGLEGDLFGGGFGGNEMTAKITMPRLRALQISGAGDVDLTGFMGERLELTLSGAAELDGHSSRYETLSLSMSGAGDIDFRDVTVTNADVSVSGAGDLSLTMAGGTLTGHMSGAGDLRYYGTVSQENVTTSGMADVRHVD
jgi:hypothetical protein